MTDQEIREKVKHALDTSLSGLPADPFLARRVINTAEAQPEGKGEKKVIRKLSIGLILALVLVMVSTTALALTNWDSIRTYFESVRAMASSGELDRWSDEDKLKLFDAMHAAGLTDENDERVITAANTALPLEERAQAADAFISERYGADYFNSHTIEEIEFPEENRTEEEQKEFDAWDEAYRAAENEAAKENPLMQETEIYKHAVSFLTEEGYFPPELIRQAEITGEFSETGADVPGGHAADVWIVTMSIDKETYLAGMRSMNAKLMEEGKYDGTDSVFDYGAYEKDGKRCFTFYLDKYGNYLGAYDQNAAEVTEEKATELAYEAMRVRLGKSKEDLAKYTLKVGSGESGDWDQALGMFRADYYFSWKDGDATKFFVEIDAKTGTILEVIDWEESERMREQGFAWRDELREVYGKAGLICTNPYDHERYGLYDENGNYFWDWSLEKRAAFSQSAIPLFEQFKLDHPGLEQYLQDVAAGKYAFSVYDNIFIVTDHVYGLPDEKAISQEEAFRIAYDEALRQGARASDLADNTARGAHTFYYDVTDPEHPLWKVHINLLFGDSDGSHVLLPTDPEGYFVKIDAYTGEIVEVITRTVDTPMRDLV